MADQGTSLALLGVGMKVSKYPVISEHEDGEAHVPGIHCFRVRMFFSKTNQFVRHHDFLWLMVPYGTKNIPIENVLGTSMLRCLLLLLFFGIGTGRNGGSGDLPI